MDSEAPTAREQDVLKAISCFAEGHGFPPSVRELCEELGVSAPSTVHQHLASLEKKGYLKRHKGFRALEFARAAAETIGGLLQIPILGRVPAGPPNLAVEDVEGYIKLDPESVKGKDLFALRVKGDSMEQAGIFAGDTIVVKPAREAKNGDIVVARIDDDVTVKRWRIKRGQPWLEPANPNYQPIAAGNAELVGIVISLVRNYASGNHR